MAYALCLALNKEGIIPIICDVLYDEMEDELITEEDELLKYDDDGYPDELLTIVMEDLTEEEIEMEAEDTPSDTQESSHIDNLL